MFVRMITYDSEYGDANIFDDYHCVTETYDDLLSRVLGRFDWLIKNRTLIVDRETEFATLVEPRSGKQAETYLIAYQSEHDSAKGINGLELSNSIFYDPDTKEMSCGIEAYSFMDCLPDTIDDGALEVWGLGDLLQNPPPELGVRSVGPERPPNGWELTNFLFDLYQSRIASK